MDIIVDQVRKDYVRLCKDAGLRPRFHCEPQHDGSAHVEFDGVEYKYIVTERGSELQRRQTTDRSELLYWLISDVVFDAAIEFEVRNRIEGQDFRRLFFAKRIEIMKSIRHDWGEKLRAEIENILESHPYRDEL